MNWPSRLRHVVVEGPIGAGKTTLVRRLVAVAGGSELLERPGDNPFLPGFYEDPRRYALPVQLFFLFQRVEQLRARAQGDLFGQVTVADFMLEKDPLFARLTLEDDEYRLYEQVYERLKPEIPAPDLVIYLQASTDRLVERVRRRAIGYERRISEEYLERLAASYSQFFYRYEAAPVLIVNSDHLDFSEGDEDFGLLLQQMADMRGRRAFFSRGG
ncbi:MAG: deoxynucleoside kinase [Pseudomonadota bacterium]|jgi:deoxyguanosine kinase